MTINCRTDRSFSKLKLTGNRLRASVTQERLVNLVIMSTESDVLHDIDCTFRDKSFQPITWLWYWQNKPTITKINTRNPEIYAKKNKN